MTYKAVLADRVLFDAFQRGNQDAFMEIYHSLKRPVYSCAIKMVGSAEEAEDLTVEAFTRVWERRLWIESMAHLKNFLFIAVRNSAIKFLEKKERGQIELTPDVDAEINASVLSSYNTDQLFADLVEDILALIGAMPRLRGLVFRMRYLEEKSVSEVAAALGLSVQSVYWHTKEALAQARAALAETRFVRSKAVLLFLLLSATLIRSF